MKKLLVGTILTLFLLSMATCQRIVDSPNSAAKLELPATVFDYITIKTQFGNTSLKHMANDGTADVFNNHTATLGRVLFYDQSLSINNSVSCGSCHNQAKGFTDGKKHSMGFGGKILSRNTPAILKTIAGTGLFWDLRASNALALSLEPVFNHLEMGIVNEEMLLEKVSSQDYYPALFEKAYGSTEINKDKIAKAIAVFMNSLFTPDLRTLVDSKQWKDAYEKSALVNLGKDLYFSNRTKCAVCHSASLSFGGGYAGTNSPVMGSANIGLDQAYNDNGVSEGNFKIPDLINVGLSAPYMHDGRYNTLEEVVEHYNSRIKKHPKLAADLMSNGEPLRLNLSEIEKQALVAFLKSLNDDYTIKDPKFSDPFKH